MSANVKKYLLWVGLIVLGVVIDRKTGGKLTSWIGKIPGVGPALVG